MERTEVEKFDSESSESIDWEKNNRKRNQVLGNSMDQIRCITKTSLEYPKKMMQYPSMPAKLYVKGRMPDPDKITVAVIGARMCSPYGRIQAFRYAKELSQAGVQIISGMALGIQKGIKEPWKGKCLHLRCWEVELTCVIRKQTKNFTREFSGKMAGLSVNVRWVRNLYPGIFRRVTASSVPCQMQFWW